MTGPLDMGEVPRPRCYPLLRVGKHSGKPHIVVGANKHIKSAAHNRHRAADARPRTLVVAGSCLCSANEGLRANLGSQRAKDRVIQGLRLRKQGSAEAANHGKVAKRRIGCRRTASAPGPVAEIAVTLTVRSGSRAARVSARCPPSEWPMMLQLVKPSARATDEWEPGSPRTDRAVQQ